MHSFEYFTEKELKQYIKTAKTIKVRVCVDSSTNFTIKTPITKSKASDLVSQLWRNPNKRCAVELIKDAGDDYTLIIGEILDNKPSMEPTEYPTIPNNIPSLQV